jgi:hypothetical protein
MVSSSYSTKGTFCATVVKKSLIRYERENDDGIVNYSRQIYKCMYIQVQYDIPHRNIFFETLDIFLIITK